jgi:hypothetical protein
MTIASRFLARTMKLPPATNGAVQVERDLRVPMPDGVELLADRYVPAGGGRAPLVLVRSPYGRRGFWGLTFGRLLAERGFQVVIQSCRGTFGSGGTLDPFGPDEHDDGLATVAWLREQPWYPGAFGTVGPSYLGMTQWAIAADAGPDLKAIAAQVTSADFRSPFYAGESFYLETALGWVDQVARQEQPLAVIRQSRAERKIRPLLDRLPLRDLDKLATGHHVTYYQQWLTHNEPDDDYWDRRRFSGTLDRVTAPVSMVTGWHDIFLPLQLRDYAALRAAGREPYLTIGPWRHADQPALTAWVSDSVAWLRAHLADDRSGLRAQPVRILVTGADDWRELPAWPPPTDTQRWHLQASGGLATAASAPAQVPAAAQAQAADPAPAPDPAADATLAEADRYRYDPADPTPNLGGPVGNSGRARVELPRARGPARRADLHQRGAGRRHRGDRRARGRTARAVQPGAHRFLRAAVRRGPGRSVDQHLRRPAAPYARPPGTRAGRHHPGHLHAVAARAPVPPRAPAATAGIERRSPPVCPQHRQRRATRDRDHPGPRRPGGLPRSRPSVGGHPAGGKLRAWCLGQVPRPGD